ncbi:hypothetical protein Tco_0474592 [Tanacetum coccineum]
MVFIQECYGGQDMALPPRDQRHQYLRYKGLRYTDADIVDFETRLARIYRRVVHRVHVFDFGGLPDLMAEGLKWISSTGDFLGTAPSYTTIRDPILRLCHRLIACSISRRSQAPKKVTVTDLFYLRGMDVGSVNVPYLLARYLREGFEDLIIIAPELPIIDMAELVRLQICMEIDDTWAWVALGPKRQPNTMAGAPKFAEDAPVVDEGDQAVLAPIQAPQQPPPPPPAAGRTMPQRLGRLEEEVQGLRQDVRTLRGLVERSMTDQGRFSTWMISCMTQLMKATRQTYQAFNGTFRGSSPATFQRRTRQRTDGASTSTAQSKTGNDEPMWAANRVVAPTPGFVITIPKTANEFAIKGNSNTDTDKIMARMDAMTIKMDARYKELQSHAKQPTPDLDDDDMPMSREEEAKFMQTFCKTHFYNDYYERDSNRDNWCSSRRNDYNRDNYRSNTDDKPYDLQKQFNVFMKSQQSTNASVKETFMDLKTQLETVTKNHQALIQNLETKFDRLADKQSGRPSGSLPSNTQPNP